MKKNVLLLVCATAMAVPPALVAGEATAFGEIAQHYEAIRQALIKDSTSGVAEHARAIHDLAAGLESDFSAARAGVPAQQADAVRGLMDEVATEAGELASAEGLANIRSQLAELSKPLVRWQAVIQGERPVVVYCPMEKKSWLQPDEPVGNPYAPSMLRCGEVVAR